MTARLTVLLLANQPDIPTQVLYALRAAGHRVAVLGNRWTRHFRYSRHVASFQETEFDVKGAYAEPKAAAETIYKAAAKAKADIVVPGDWITTPVLCAAQPHLAVPTFPLPSFAIFGHLGDKRAFAKVAGECGAPVPRTVVVEERSSLDAAAIADIVGLPAVAKPAQGGGGQGVVTVSDLAALEAIRTRADYPDGPLVVQTFIDGYDIDCSVLVREGRVEAAAVQRMQGGVLRFVSDDELVEMCGRMCIAADYTGIAHFDARRATADGRLYLIECNPRPWRSINAAELCGLNFMDLGLKAPSEARRVLTDRRFAAPRQLVPALWSGRLPLAEAWPSISNALRPLFDPGRALAERQIYRDWKAEIGEGG